MKGSSDRSTIGLDHILWGAPELEAAEQAFTELTSVIPRYGGSHPRAGTRNSIVSLGERSYLEIISVDPLQPRGGQRAVQLASLPGPRIITFAAASSDLDDIAREARCMKLGVDGPRRMRRVTPTGSVLEWRLLYLVDHDLGSALPFFIDWESSYHPSSTGSSGCGLAAFEILTPKAAEVRQVLVRLGFGFEVRSAPAIGFAARLNTPRGPVQLEG